MTACTAPNEKNRHACESPTRLPPRLRREAWTSDRGSARDRCSADHQGACGAGQAAARAIKGGAGLRPFREVPEWWCDWRGETAVIVASGPSAKDVPIELARGRARVLTVNKSWELAPWCDALYACDARFWEVHSGVPDYLGLKLSQDSQSCSRPWGVERVYLEHKNEILMDTAGTIGSGGNGGFQSLNLAIQFGARRIALVGYDMRIDVGLHWHGPHQRLNNPSSHSCELWRRAIDGVADRIAELGVEVLNASPISALRNYRKVTLAEVFGC